MVSRIQTLSSKDEGYEITGDVLVVRLHLIVCFSTRKIDKEFTALGAFLMANTHNYNYDKYNYIKVQL